MFLSNLLTSVAKATITIGNNTSTVSDSDFLAVFWAIMGAIFIPLIALVVLQIVAMWKIFTKCGVEGWKSIIPIYNYVVMLQIVGINPLWILAMFIPFVGSIAGLILTIAASIRLARGFGKSDGFAVGLILLSFIFELILAFDKSTWNASKINFDSFSFLNSKERPAGATKSGAKSAPKSEDPWVNGK